MKISEKMIVVIIIILLAFSIIQYHSCKKEEEYRLLLNKNNIKIDIQKKEIEKLNNLQEKWEGIVREKEKIALESLRKLKEVNKENQRLKERISGLSAQNVIDEINQQIGTSTSLITSGALFSLADTRKVLFSLSSCEYERELQKKVIKDLKNALVSEQTNSILLKKQINQYSDLVINLEGELVRAEKDRGKVLWRGFMYGVGIGVLAGFLLGR